MAAYQIAITFLPLPPIFRGLDAMILELRTYDFAPGDALRYLSLFSAEGLPLITKHLPLAGYWLSEIGALNRLRHLWVYHDLEERAARRATLMADTAWTAGFLPRGMALIQHQVTQLIAADTISDEAAAVFSAPHRAHVTHDGPPLREGWAALAQTPLEGALFTGTVIVGADVGTTLSVAASPATPSLELMRPCAFSPL